MRKKFLTIIMSMLMVFVMMPMGTWTTYAAGGNLSQDADGYYLIEDYNDLKAFAKRYAHSYNARLTNDITCTDDDWVTIGNGSVVYDGTFDGDGHIIKGLSNKSSGAVADTQGLIGQLGFGGKVINVGIEGGSITGIQYVGSIVGINYGEIINCYNTGEVNGTETRVGGIAGMNFGVIKNCYNTGKLSVTENYIGGITGYNTYDNFLENEAEITNCYNTGSISCTEEGYAVYAGYAGGIAGLNERAKITNCYNTGKVSSTGTGACGVVGINFAGGKIENCYFDKTLNPGLRTVYNNSGEVDRNSVISLPTTQMTGTNALRYMPFTNQDPWLTKADGEDPDTSEYYRYYPHLKGFDYDNSSEVKDWPPKVTVKAEWNGVVLYTYNGSAQKPTVNKITISNGSTDVTVDPVDYTVSYYVKDGDTYTAITEDIVDVGNYKAVITFKAGGIAAGHGPIEKEFVIDKANPAIETAPAASAITYGQSLANSSLSDGIAKVGDKKVDGIFTWTDNTIKPAVSDSNATEYEVTFTPADLNNYMTATTKVKLTVNKADITPSVSIQGWSYGSEANKPEVEGNTGGGTETFMYKEKDAEDTAYTEKVPTDAGTYTVKAEVAETDNYNSGSATLDFTIAPADMQVTSSGVNVDFDGSGHSITVNAPEGASVEYSQDGGKTYSTMNPAYTDAGSYTVPFTVILKNYKRYEGTEQVIIHQAPNSVSVSIEGWIYGEPAHIPSVDAKFGADHAVFSYSDAPDGTYNPGGPDQAGTWYLKATVPETQAYAGAESAPFSFEIAKAQLTITAKNQTYEYNKQEQGEGKEEDTAYTDTSVITEKVTVEGLQNDDVLTSVTLTGHRKTIGEYQDEIKITDFAINDDAAAKDNYDVTLVPGKLTITKHILTETKEVPATCEKDGTKAYWTCSECNKMFSDKDGENEITEPEVIKATGHDWGEWVETEAATEEKEGSETRACKNDPKHTETRAIPAAIAYRNVSGEGNTWYKGSDATLDFSFKRSIDDASTISHFTGIRVDNNDVDEANYSKESGSVIIKLKPEYLETLALGKHTLEARFDDGNGSAAAEFTIAEAEKENTDDEGDDVNGNGGSSKGSKDSKDSKKSVRTGDESLVAFWASLLGVSMIGLIMLFAARLRLRRKDR